MYSFIPDIERVYNVTFSQIKHEKRRSYPFYDAVAALTYLVFGETYSYSETARIVRFAQHSTVKNIVNNTKNRGMTSLRYQNLSKLPHINQQIKDIADIFTNKYTVSGVNNRRAYFKKWGYGYILVGTPDPLRINQPTLVSSMSYYIGLPFTYIIKATGIGYTKQGTSIITDVEIENKIKKYYKGN